MDGNPLLNPVGALPPQVYWRRRALAGLLAVLVLWFAWSVLPGKSGANAAQGTGRSAKTPATAPSTAAALAAGTTTPPVAVVTTPPAATVTSAAPVAAAVTTPAVTKPAVLAGCSAAALHLVVSTDHRVYAAGALPTLALDVVNVSATPCRVDVGTPSRDFVVRSGSDRIWSSADCAKSSPNVVTFTPKESVGYTHQWNRLRSSASACTTAGAKALPGTYTVTAYVGDLVSGVAVFTLD